MTISGYVPFYNNATTVIAAVESLKRQTTPLDEVFAVDDGSTDHGAELLEAAGFRVIRMGANFGRGAVRARAMKEAQHEFVICCDATNVLPHDFASRAIAWMKHPEIAAAYGRISQRPGGNAVIRWRGRHLFKSAALCNLAAKVSTFATYGAIVRRSAVEAVRNYDSSLRHTEDAELGTRLKNGGWEIICDPDLVVYSVACNSLSQVLERYWRWYAGKDETISVRGYLRSIWYSWRVMVVADLRAGDLPAALISFYAPHSQFCRSLVSKVWPGNPSPRTPAGRDSATINPH